MSCRLLNKHFSYSHLWVGEGKNPYFYLYPTFSHNQKCQNFTWNIPRNPQITIFQLHLTKPHPGSPFHYLLSIDNFLLQSFHIWNLHHLKCHCHTNNTSTLHAPYTLDVFLHHVNISPYNVYRFICYDITNVLREN